MQHKVTHFQHVTKQDHHIAVIHSFGQQLFGILAQRPWRHASLYEEQWPIILWLWSATVGWAT